MKKAIELLEKRKERIVSAEEVYKKNKHSISIRKEKFICLECGEFVGFVSRNKDTYEPYFKHMKKSKEDHYCDLRNDNEENTNYYEKVGSSLYLKKTFSKVFELIGGFRKCDLEYIYRNNLDNEIEILSNTKKNSMKYIIDESRFNYRTKNFLKINFISNVYTLKYSNQHIENRLSKKWGKKIEGFKNGKAIFYNSGSINKKVRINSEIHTDTDYYAVVNKYFRIENQDIIKWEYVGDLLIKGNIKYKVFRLRISAFSNEGYLKLYSYFRKNFVVNLVKKPSYLDFIWPPMIQNIDVYYYYFNHFKKIYLLEMNFNDESPNLLMHSTSNSKSIQNISNNNNVFLYELNKMDNVSISANNYYTEKVIDLNFLQQDVDQSPDLLIEIYSDEILIEESNLLDKDTTGVLKFHSNFRTDVIQYRKGIFFKRYKMQSESLDINNYKVGDTFYYSTGEIENKILEISTDKVYDENSESEILQYMKRYKYTSLVNTPQWISQLKYKFKNSNFILKYLDEYYNSRRMPKCVLYKLEKYVKGDINA